MRALITGAAGFIGSNLADDLVAAGHDVVGVDTFTPYYDEAAKRANLTGLLTPAGGAGGASGAGRGSFRLVEADLRSAELAPLLDGVDVVFHHAAQPGVRLSWSDGFADYDSHNVLATQRLLEACRHASVGRLVYASSSSVYGNAATYPTAEDVLPAPYSPYGVTKLAAEHLCGLYASNWDVSTVALRYFTVYGPRQRPDMAFHRLIEAGLHGTPFPLYGTGEQVREFTYVGDVVRANVLAATADVPPGTVVNVAGGGEERLIDVIELAGELLGAPVVLDRLPAQAGDVTRTAGDVTLAEKLLGWAPEVPVAEGLARQIAWHRTR